MSQVIEQWPIEVQHEYDALVVKLTDGRMPAQVMADVGAFDGKRRCIARVYCWKGESVGSRAAEARRLAWLFVKAVEAEQEKDEAEENARRRNRQAVFQYWADQWLRRARPFAERLAGRVSALDGEFYAGCGFHYSLQDRIVVLERKLSVQPFFWDVSEDEVFRQYLVSVIVLKVRLESLAGSVAKAEISVVKNVLQLMKGDV